MDPVWKERDVYNYGIHKASALTAPVVLSKEGVEETSEDGRMQSHVALT